MRPIQPAENLPVTIQGNGVPCIPLPEVNDAIADNRPIKILCHGDGNMNACNQTNRYKKNQYRPEMPAPATWKTLEMHHVPFAGAVRDVIACPCIRKKPQGHRNPGVKLNISLLRSVFVKTTHISRDPRPWPDAEILQSRLPAHT
ncbi:hypothetical protein [Novacetimonas hansenii]|uniref:Uncharacterized protein n=1 Tax=Novacetimonas hansenii TaxID=436 RepID=A0AAW5EUI8_NOVHA|nr:hypothetical protein [Novacetimonas hansenii]MCJ8354980.1 hypothetical protein [Novacetimonas hansenii]